MQPFSSILRTPPHIINLRFGVMLVVQYQAKKERLARVSDRHSMQKLKRSF
jgi:hypothetical protein